MRVEFWFGEDSLCESGIPWGAVVGFMSCDFSAGTFQGDIVRGGKLSIECQPYDTIAVGQGGREGIDSAAIYTVGEDGSLKEVTETAKRRSARAALSRTWSWNGLPGAANFDKNTKKRAMWRMCK